MPILTRVVPGRGDDSAASEDRVLRSANCLAGDIIGDCVRVTGPRVGGLMQVTKIDILAAPTGRTVVGIIISKATAIACVVQLHGPMLGVYVALTPGGRYHIDAAARLTLTPPAPAVDAISYMQFMGNALAADELMVLPDQAIKRVG